MPQFGPIKRSDLIRALRKMGFDGPTVGGRYEYVVRRSDGFRLKIPNPHHQQEISRGLLREILRQAGIDRQTWEGVDI